ncbi:MAG: ATP-grasp domain-containing protein [Clostridiaceae bacterium]
MNFLFCSSGIYAEIIKDFKMSLDKDSRIVAVGNSNTQAALYLADKQYVVPNITDEEYIPVILEICKKEKIDAVLTFIDLEVEVLAENREKFKEIGVQVLVPEAETARLCFYKYRMYDYLKYSNIKTVASFKDFDDFYKSYEAKELDFPIFIKPETGCGSVRARRVYSLDELKFACSQESDLIIQEFIEGFELDVDVYVDTISGKAVSIFAKKKLLTNLGGTKIAFSYKDEKLFRAVEDIVSKFGFFGPIDMEFFCRDGEYYLLEINPRFSAAYLHAYGCGVDFIKLILNNLKGIENTVEIGNYEEDVLMMKYDSLVIRRKDELAKKYD